MIISSETVCITMTYFEFFCVLSSRHAVIMPTASVIDLDDDAMRRLNGVLGAHPSERLHAMPSWSGSDTRLLGHVHTDPSTLPVTAEYNSAEVVADCVGTSSAEQPWSASSVLVSGHLPSIHTVWQLLQWYCKCCHVDTLAAHRVSGSVGHVLKQGKQIHGKTTPPHSEWSWRRAGWFAMRVCCKSLQFLAF